MIKSIYFKITELIRRYGFYSTILVIVYKVFQQFKDRRLYKLINYSDSLLKSQEDTVFEKKILFSIITPVYNTNELFLRAMLDSCINQTYKEWELCIADGSSTDEPKKIIEEYIGLDKRIKYVKLDNNYGISGNTNKAFNLATGDYIVLLDHDDILHPAALYENMVEICKYSPDFIYSDMVSFIGTIKNLFHYDMKPKLAIYTLRSLNYICHLSVYSMKIAKEVGPFEPRYDSAQDYDMILKLVERARAVRHIPKILYFWRAHSSSMSFNTGSKPASSIAAINAISDHYQRLKVDATVSESSLPTTFKTKFHHKNQAPKVAIIVLVKSLMPINYFIKHIMNNTHYIDYEIIIATNICKLDIKKTPNVKVVFTENNSTSIILNSAVHSTNAEQLLFIDPSVELLDDKLLPALLNYAQLDDVGVVTAKILNNRNSIFASGIGISNTKTFIYNNAGIHKRFLPFIRKLTYAHNITAVPQVLFMVKRSLLERYNFFNELYTDCCYSEDLSLRLIKDGYNNIFTPYTSVRYRQDIIFNRHDYSVFRSLWELMLDNGDPFGNHDDANLYSR